MEIAWPFTAQVARARWLFVLRGVVSILFGIGAFVWPGMTIIFLVAFVGAILLRARSLPSEATAAPDA